jgi:hypothetical protein
LRDSGSESGRPGLVADGLDLLDLHAGDFALSATTGLHLCFYARSRADVDGFHDAGVEAGFRSNGPPGLRDYAPG